MKDPARPRRGARRRHLAEPCRDGRLRASLESSDPSNGELLDRAPDRISLTFTEPPDLSLTIGVLDDTGAPVPTGPPELVPGSDHEYASGLIRYPMACTR